MNEYSYCDELKEKYHIADLESKTLKYRIDGFVYAMGMDLENGECNKEISSMRMSYINKRSNEDGLRYNINFSYNYDKQKGKSIVMIGSYNEMAFSFINYSLMDKNKDKINEIPFEITMVKKFSDYSYVLKIYTTVDTMAKFRIDKYQDAGVLSGKVAFCSNVIDFGDVLKLIKTFVNNPEYVFRKYDEVMNQKEVVFTNSDLKKAIENDEKLEKPMGKTRKKIKMILNNH